MCVSLLLCQVVTFWEGEIVDTKNYTFFTGKWEATYVLNFFHFFFKNLAVNDSDGGQSNPILIWMISCCRPEDDIRHWTKFPSFSPLLVKSWKFSFKFALFALLTNSVIFRVKWRLMVANP